jgi:hypothetical protein
LDYFAYFCSMKSKRLAIFTLSLLISNGCLAQEVSEPVAHQYKRYHGDGIDNVLEYVPTAAVFGLKLLGVPAESSWKRRLTVSVVSFGINAVVTYSLKHTIHEMRPDGTDNHSFPSGHTAVAFCGATTLMHEYRKVSPWIGVAGYAVATTVAVDRVRRNRHHWGDVVAGAAIGVASAEAGYWIGDIILGKGKKKKQDVSLSVAPMGMTLVARL